MRILVLEHENYSESALQKYRSLGMEVILGDGSDGDLAKISVLVCRLGRHLSKEFLSSYPNLNYIVSPTTGLNHIDEDYCKQRDIEIISLRGKRHFDFLQTITATAEHSFGLLLALVRGMIPAHASVMTGVWDRNLFIGRELSALKLSIVGFGRLGRKMSEYARAFNMKVFACDPHVSQEVMLENSVTPCTLAECLDRADVVSLHANYRPGDPAIFGENEFASMRHGAYFVNTARGELVNEQALLAALETGKLAGAAIDVLAGEHTGLDLSQHPLLCYARNHGNLIVTPHLGGASIDSMRKTEDYAAEQLITAVSQKGGTSQ